jgi:RNA polymerase sigma-70 factor (ECF subfamily)
VTGPEFTELLRRVRNSDERAFADLWRRYQPLVLRYARVLIGDAADDVASETWIAVVRSLDRFEGDETNFRTWLMTICRHRAMDWGRDRQRNPVVLAEHEQLDRSSTPSPDPAVLVIDAISATEAVTLIERTLPPLQAEAVILRSVVGLDVPEVARIMNKRSGAVRVLTHRGLRQLQQLFAKSADVEFG